MSVMSGCFAMQKSERWYLDQQVEDGHGGHVV